MEEPARWCEMILAQAVTAVRLPLAAAVSWIVLAVTGLSAVEYVAAAVRG